MTTFIAQIAVAAVFEAVLIAATRYVVRRRARPLRRRALLSVIVQHGQITGREIATALGVGPHVMCGDLARAVEDRVIVMLRPPRDGGATTALWGATPAGRIQVGAGLAGTADR